jgi:hypothetical protein
MVVAESQVLRLSQPGGRASAGSETHAPLRVEREGEHSANASSRGGWDEAACVRCMMRSYASGHICIRSLRTTRH